MKRFASALLLALLTPSLAACVASDDRREDLKIAFREQIRSCYTLPKQAQGAEAIVLEVRVKPNGSLAQAPRVIRGSADSPVARAALHAVNSCAPFRIPPEMAYRYADWKIMRIAFETN